MRPTSTLLLFLAPFVLTACLGADCVTGTGKAMRKDLQVQAFHGIELQGAIDVQLTPGAVQAVSVEAQPNLAELLVIEVKNGQCMITTSKCWSSKEPFVVHITAPVIDRVVVNGSGNVTGTGSFTVDKADISVQGSGDVKLTLDAGSITAQVQGSGDVKLGGRCDMFTCQVQGSGKVKAEGLKATRAKVEVAGSGDIAIDAQESLAASIMGSGDVRYVTRPASLTEQINGSGTIGPVKKK